MAERDLDSSRIWFPLLILSVIFCVLFVATNAIHGLSFHAIEKHGDEAFLVRQCMEHRGAIQEWLQSNGRIARVCELADGRFGIEIVDQAGENVTAFIKNKLRTLEQVEQYLMNKGAQLLWTAR